MRILLDLDCVLADFVRGGAAAHGLTIDELLPYWPIGEYAMDSAIGSALEKSPWGFNDFWRPLNGRRKFWADLEPLPWAEALVTLVKSLTDDWWIVTSPSKCEQCVPGKRDWCNRFFGEEHFERLIPLSQKYLLAGPQVILIDDYDKNVTEFNEAGGTGIVFPAHHNSRHELKDESFRVASQTLQRKAQCL